MIKKAMFMEGHAPKGGTCLSSFLILKGSGGILVGKMVKPEIWVERFFVGEQFGVGGDVPFYDRYILQLAPFLGLIAFFLIPKLTTSRATALAGMYLLSQEMLWRFLFIR